MRTRSQSRAAADAGNRGAGAARAGTVEEATDDLVWDHCAAFDVSSDPTNRGMPAGFVLGVGRRLVIRDCVAAGVRGGEHASGFHWPAFANHAPDNVWESSDLVAHNCTGDGVNIWQDDDHRHHVERLVSYRNSGWGPRPRRPAQRLSLRRHRALRQRGGGSLAPGPEHR